MTKPKLSSDVFRSIKELEIQESDILKSSMNKNARIFPLTPVQSNFSQTELQNIAEKFGTENSNGFKVSSEAKKSILLSFFYRSHMITEVKGKLFPLCYLSQRPGLFSFNDTRNLGELDNPFAFGLKLLTNRLQAEVNNNHRHSHGRFTPSLWKPISTSNESLSDLNQEVKAGENAAQKSKLTQINDGKGGTSRNVKQIIIGKS